MKTLTLASDVFLAAWDATYTGRPRIHRQGVALSLAGAVLCDLVLRGRLRIAGSDLHLQAGPGPGYTGDPVLDRVLTELHDARQHTAIRTWLAYLAQQTIPLVANQLIRDGLIVAAEPRLLRHRPARYFNATPEAWSDARWPSDRIRQYLRHRRALDIHDLVLFTLAGASSLAEALMDDPATREESLAYLSALPTWLPPPLACVVAHVHAAIGEAVLTHRT